MNFDAVRFRHCTTHLPAVLCSVEKQWSMKRAPERKSVAADAEFETALALRSLLAISVASGFPSTPLNERERWDAREGNAERDTAMWSSSCGKGEMVTLFLLAKNEGVSKIRANRARSF